jgi:putative component of membrane protein insertase Oxa1/YidC/SpoIIIJ protein YidD
VASAVGGHDSGREERCVPPWEFSRVDSSLVDATPALPEAVGPERLVLSVLMRTYKRAISPAGGRRCGMYPSCSSYARDAVQNLGAVVGVLMACDRLLRCGNDPHFYHLVRDNGRVLRSDTVDNARRDSE